MKKYLKFENGKFVWYGPMDHVPKSAGFIWNSGLKRWETVFPGRAWIIRQHADLKTIELLKRKMGKKEKVTCV